MIFEKLFTPMCIFCGRRTRNIKIRANGVSVCSECFLKLPDTCGNKSFQPFGSYNEFEYFISPFFYEGSFREAILSYKFNGSFAYAKIFAELLKLKTDTEHLKTFDMVIPVPLSEKRMKERGYNQSALIARPFAEFLGTEYSETSLVRVKNTKRQSGLTKPRRNLNVKNAFSASGVLGKTVIVFDDIYTTGFTLNECAKTLKSAGAKKVIGLTLAVAPRGLVTADEHMRRIF